jgi:hypothetical protein
MITLQPGDKIHLALPLTPRTVSIHERAQAEAESLREAENAISFFRAEYRKLGVEIVVHSASQSITCPTVVAVFRSTPAVEAQR